ncbi:MAG: hypothetical protein MUC88_23530, partial [Planctomycetes bacterium]|nr:hypothetical protein [Planctomycetota bacterium]
MRHLGQYMMRVGQEQYDRGLYDQAQKTFQMAQGYKAYLDAEEQRALQSLEQKAGSAAVERQRVVAARQAAEESRRKGDFAAARAALESIQRSEVLTEIERQEIAYRLQGDATPTATPTQTADTPVTPAPKAPETAGRDSAPAAGLRSVAVEYYESVKAYLAGDMTGAKAGFTKVLQNEALPPQMAETVRGYLAEIEVRQANSQSVALAGMPARTLPAVGVAALANTPAAGSAAAPAQSEVERIAELYTRSLELYSQGEYAAARQGFVDVAKSGLFQAQEGRRPEDYIATIDRLLAASQGTQPAPTAAPVTAPSAPVEPVVPTPVTVTPPAPVPVATTVTPPAPTPTAAAPTTESTAPPTDSSIDVINRRKGIIRSHTEAVVNDAVTEAQKLIGQGEFNAALDHVMEAQRIVNEAQFYLGDDLYKEYTQRLNQAADRVRNAEAERAKVVETERRQQAAEAEKRTRDQAETDRANRIKELMARAKAYSKQQQYEAALGQLEALLHLDPLNDEALTLKQMVQDMVNMRRQIEVDELSRTQRAQMLLDAEEASVPYADEITYPKDWREVMQRPTRKPDEPFQLDPANAIVYQQLDQVVDLSQLTPQTPVSEAIDIMRKTVTPPLNIVVLWRDLQMNVSVEPTTEIGMDGLPNIRLGTALENLVKAISDPAYPDNPVDFVVNKGVVTVATLYGLPQKKMETRVYDIADLVGQAANYATMGQMMGMFGGMMGSGASIMNYSSIMGGGGGTGGTGGLGGGGGYGGGGGFGGGGMGGMGGMGMMGGMGGMMGGMGGMGGMMGGMGGMMGGMGGMMGGGMGGMMGGGMGGMGGGMGGMGGYGGGMGGMGGYGGGMGGMMGGGMAYGLRQLIEESINPESWLDLSLDPTAQGQITLYPQDVPKTVTA